MAATSVLDKVMGLVAKAVDDGTPEEEARSSALAALRLLKDNDLTIAQREHVAEVEKKIDGLSRELARVKAEGTSKMVLGAAFGYGFSKFMK